MSLPIYIGAFLTAESKALLLAQYPPKHPNVYADHLTIIFRPSEEETALCNSGILVYLKVVGHMYDVRGQAVLIQSLFACKNDNPHVTISTEIHTNPVYSNQLIRSPSSILETFSGPILSAILDTYPRRSL